MENVFQRFYHYIFRFYPDAILLCDSDGIIKDGNEQAFNMFQNYANVKNRSVFECFHMLNDKEICEISEAVKKTGKPAVFEAVVAGLPSSIVNIPLIEDQRFYGFAFIIKDISQVKEADKKIEYLTQFDDLTNLPNERTTFAFLNAVCQKGVSTAIVKLQIRRFKYINEIFGKEVSNEVIRAFAGQLKALFPDTYFIGRLSNNEFLIIMEDVADQEDFIRNITIKLENLKDLLDIHGQEIYYDYSIGIAFYPMHGQDPETLIKNSEIAIQIGMQKNERIAQFNNIKSKSFERRIYLENELYKSVKKKELSLYYQPIVDTKAKHIIGFEVLLRWPHKELGMVSPAEFIPIAEETGLIVEIGKWSMEQACRQLQEWRQKGYRDLKISLNMSIKQFYQHDVVDMIQELLIKYNIPPECFEIEFTESVPMYNLEWFMEIIQKLKKLHIKLSIDDFGTGYSSLSYLTKLKLDKIKIDRSFIQNLSMEKETDVVVKTIIALAKNLKLAIVAEGVEKKEQISFLQNHHCFQMQGFYFSKPIPSEEAFQLLQKKQDDIFL